MQHEKNQLTVAVIKDEENNIKEYVWPLKARKSREIDFSLEPSEKNPSGFLWWLSGKESACQCRRQGSIPDLGRSQTPMCHNY